MSQHSGAPLETANVRLTPVEANMSEPHGGATMTSEPFAVRLRGICKHFGSEPVLYDVGFDLHRSSFTSIVGPSGCGKTTLLRMIAGLEVGDAGEFTIANDPHTGGRARLAVVFQQGSLLPWKSVRRNVAFGLEMAGVDRREIQGRVERALTMVNLAGAAEKYPYQLSGGMQQRVGIARALALDPQVLLMDEPFASVDAQTREQLHDELIQIWERTRMAVLFVTHSIDEAIVLSDDIIVMGTRPGRILDRFQVSLPRPRSEESAHSSPEFGELRHAIRSLLNSGPTTNG